MDDERKNIVAPGNPASPYPYGTFQGVANYYPPAQAQAQAQTQAQAVVVFPNPIVHPGQSTADPRFPGYNYQNFTGNGYSNYYPINQTVPGYVVYEGRPMRERRLPCCGLGMGWFLFICGFFLGGLPWYIGAFIALCVHVDYREKPGYVACAIVSALVMLAVTLGVTNDAHTWLIAKFAS